MKNYTRHIMTAVLCLCTVSCRLVSDKGESIPEVIASQAGETIIEDNRTYTYTAVARPVRVHRFTAPFDCVVESMDAREGGKAVKGQVLARLYSATLSASVRDAAANLARLEAELGKASAATVKTRGRNQEEIPDEMTGTAELRKKVEAAREELAKARKLQSACTIRAPFDAEVTVVGAAAGASLSTGDELLTIIDPTRTELVAYIEAEALPEMGQVLLFQGRDTGISAVMVRCSPKPNRMNGCYECVFEPETQEGQPIASGTELKFKLSGGIKELVTIPSGALRQDGASHYVWVIKTDSTVSRRPVVLQEEPLDIRDGKRTVVISGLEGDETLVTGGFDGLQDSTKVKIRKED